MDEAPAPNPRLNPFAFPSDTTFRFVLLTVAVLTTSLFIFNWLYLWRYGDESPVPRCRQLASEAVPQARSVEEKAAELKVVARCLAPWDRRLSAWMYGGTAAVATAAVAIYLLTPAWKRRRRRLRPLTAEDAPGVLECVGELVSQSGLRRAPTLLWNPAGTGGDALAFGRPGRYQVALGPGLVASYYANRPAFEAVVRHELSHVRNRDIPLAYLANSTWYAFLLVAMVPYGVSHVQLRFWRAELSHNAALLVRITALVVLVYLTRNALLRSREYYADVRAAAADGSRHALEQVVATAPHAPQPRWRGLVSVHPTSAQRRQVLGDPNRLFRLSPWDALGAGLVAAMGIPLVAGSFSPVFRLLDITGEREEIVAALLFTPLLGATIGVGLWRSQFASRVEGSWTRRSHLIALAVALGLVAGERLSLTYGGGSLVSPVDAGGEVVAAGFVLAAVVVLVAWITSSADLWLDLVPARRSARALYLPVLVVTAIVFWWITNRASAYARFWSSSERLADVDMGFEDLARIFGYFRSTLLLLATLSVYPLVAVFRRRSRRTEGGLPSWALLGRSLTRPWPPRPPVDLRRLLHLGVVAGALFTLWLGATRLVLRLTLSEAERDSTAFVVGLQDATQWVSAGLQVAVGVLVAHRSRRAPLPVGLAAGFLAGVVATAGFVAVNPFFGGEVDLDFVWNVAGVILGFGGLATILAVAVTAAIVGRRPAGVDTGTPGEPGDQPTGPKRRRPALVAAGALGLTALVVGVASDWVADRIGGREPYLAAQLTEYTETVLPLAEEAIVVRQTIRSLTASPVDGSDAAGQLRSVTLPQVQELNARTRRMRLVVPEIKRLHRLLVQAVGHQTTAVEHLAKRYESHDPSLDSTVQDEAAAGEAALRAWTNQLQLLMQEQGVSLGE